jgi:molecular chaperone GrpE
VSKKEQNTHTISNLDREQKTELTRDDEQTGSGDLPSESRTTPPQEDSVRTEKSEEVQALQNKYLRLAAEFENYKRLAQRDQREHARFANEQILKELLPIIDNLERAIKFSKDSAAGNGLIQGVELTLKQFLETLGKFGVRPISSVGEVFDPSRHQAVAHVRAEAPDKTVVEEYQKGYLLHDRVLRAAMVAVAAGPDDSANPVPDAFH